MKAVKKFERGGYKFTSTINEDFIVEIVSDDIPIENGGFISNWNMIPLPKMLDESIDQWIESMQAEKLRDAGKSENEIQFILTAKSHGYEIIENKNQKVTCSCDIKHRDLKELQSGKCMDCEGTFKK